MRATKSLSCYSTGFLGHFLQREASSSQSRWAAAEPFFSDPCSTLTRSRVRIYLPILFFHRTSKFNVVTLGRNDADANFRFGRTRCPALAATQVSLLKVHVVRLARRPKPSTKRVNPATGCKESSEIKKQRPTNTWGVMNAVLLCYISVGNKHCKVGEAQTIKK